MNMMYAFIGGYLLCSVIMIVHQCVLNTKIAKQAFWKGQKAGFEAAIAKIEGQQKNAKTNFKSKSL